MPPTRLCFKSPRTECSATQAVPDTACAERRRTHFWVSQQESGLHGLRLGSPQGRSGFALVAVLVAMVFVFAMIAVIAASLNLQADEINSQLAIFQQENLLRSAADRASFMISRDPEYIGESWTPPTAAGNVTFEIRVISREERDVTVTPCMLNGDRPANKIFSTRRYRIESGYVIPL